MRPSWALLLIEVGNEIENVADPTCVLGRFGCAQTTVTNSISTVNNTCFIQTVWLAYGWEDSH